MLTGNLSHERNWRSLRRQKGAQAVIWFELQTKARLGYLDEGAQVLEHTEKLE